jgi:hypothetical protein
MLRRILFISLIALICSGCMTPTRLSPWDIHAIHGISLAIDTTLAHDISGFTDSIDVPASKVMADKVLELSAETLRRKGFRVVGHHLSIGMADPDESYYVIAQEQDRKRDTSELENRPGPFYSQRLGSQQLAALYKNIAKVRFASNSAVARMGFAGDATLLIQVQGRTIGSDKSIGAFIGNIALITLNILAAAGGSSSGGSSDLMDIDDSYRVHLRLYRTRDGDVLWRTDFKSDSIKEMLKETVENLRYRIPAKPGDAG